MRRPVSSCQMRRALLDRVHRRQRLHAKLGVDPAPRQIVEDVDLVSEVRQVQRRRPADETVTAENRDLHRTALHVTRANWFNPASRFH